ncbi:MAG: hypothetical protein HY910_15535 [Desulfarculus sp.]|nr:hypothetical protein [Desulfarculus sp.]
MSHGFLAVIMTLAATPAAQAGGQAPAAEGPRTLPLWARALWGLGVILGLSGALFYWKAARIGRRGPDR